MKFKQFYEEEAKFIRCDETNKDAVVRVKRMILPLLPKQAEKILDVGCGDGYLVSSLRLKGFDAVGIDLSETRIKIAKKRYGNYFKTCSVYDIKSKEEFDVVISSEVIEHLSDPERAIREMKKTSKRYIILTFPYKEKLVTEVCPHCLKRYYRSGHIQYFNWERIKKILGSNGLSILKVRKVAYYPFINFPFLVAALINKFLEIMDKTTYIGLLCKIKEVE